MLIQDLMWDVFTNTGEVTAYLLYRQCQECYSVYETKGRSGK
ncbi:MAG: YqzL-like protein [Firmicutes bacterium]|nr:YqzL-like protein [Bacillota bacterium]